MVGEVFGAVTALRNILDMSKRLQEIHDDRTRKEAIADLIEKVISAREAQLALIDRVDELERENAAFKNWEATKARYDLKDLGFGSFAYMLRREARGAEPPHWACTNCFEHGHKAIVQKVMLKGRGLSWVCPSCRNTIEPRKCLVWLD